MPGAPYEPDDADTVLSDFGIDVVVDGQTLKGLLDTKVGFETVHGVPVSEGDHVVSLKRGALGDLPIDTDMKVNGDCYVYRGPVDGAVGIFDHFAVVRATG